MLECLRRLLTKKHERVLYRARRKFGVEIPLFKYNYRERLIPGKGQHGWCSDIPKEESGKTIMSVVRNPFDHYVSEFEFGWWKKDLCGLEPRKFDPYFADVEAIRRRFPRALEWKFPQFLKVASECSFFSEMAIRGNPAARSLGMCTHRFVYFYCKDPDYVFRAADSRQEFVDRVREQLYPVQFLRQQNLNRDLYDFLARAGYAKKDLEFV